MLETQKASQEANGQVSMVLWNRHLETLELMDLGGTNPFFSIDFQAFLHVSTWTFQGFSRRPPSAPGSER